MFDLQLFGDQEPSIPDELQGLPNQDLVREIMEEEGLTQPNTDAEESGEQDQKVEDEVKQPETKPEVKSEDMDFWKRKAEEMEKAMYEERGKRKKERELREEAERQLLYKQPQPEAEEIDPLAQEVKPYIKQMMEADPELKEVREFIATQKQQQEILEYAEKSQEAAKQRYADFDDVTGPVVDAARNNPELARYILSQADPAEYAYTIGIRHKYETMRQQESQKQTEKLTEIAKHPRAGQVKGASTVNMGEINPDTMTANEWGALDPKLRQKLLMGG